MSKLVEINWRPDDRVLRQFGWIALIGFGFVAVIAWFEVLIFAAGLGPARPYVAGVCVGLGLLSAIFGLVWPRANQPIYVGLSVLTFPIGFVVSYTVLSVLFFGLIAPVALLFRLTGRDPMNRRYEPGAESYWSEAPAARSKESYFRQY
jgi:hypothetical protein